MAVKKWLKNLKFSPKVSVLTLGGPSLTGETAFTPESVAKFLKSTTIYGQYKNPARL
jgi:hypothetical protein